LLYELLFYNEMQRKVVTPSGGKMMLFNWPQFTQKQPQPVYQPYVSPETARIIQALRQGQRSQIMPMPAPRPSRPPR
jgi:hypothetical protein